MDLFILTLIVGFIYGITGALVTNGLPDNYNIIIYIIGVIIGFLITKIIIKNRNTLK